MADTRRPDIQSNKDVAETEVMKLLKDGIRGKIPTSKITDLRRKFADDDLVDRIQTAFYERLEEISHRAKKFVKLIKKKFGDKGYPLHTVLKEANKIKDKYELTDLEFGEFKLQYEKMLRSNKPIGHEDLLIPNTNMAQLFGDITSVDGLVIRDADYPVINEIIKLYNMSKLTQATAVTQSIEYTSCAPEVLEAKYDPTRHMLSAAVNPLLVAMFTPKVNTFDLHFLYTNLAFIIKCKYEKVPIENMADRHLLYQIIIDSNDIVCSADSTVKDLRLRCNLQNNLWNAVINIRDGKFFEPSNVDFFGAVNDCKLSLHDAPDLLVSGDEGTILQRLFSALSFNTVLFVTEPIFGVGGTANPIGFPIVQNRVVARPIITVRVGLDASNPVSLESQVKTTQNVIENGMVVPKVHKLISVRGVLIFHIPRRTLNPADAYGTFINPIPNFTQIPAHVLVNETVNSTPIQFSELIVFDEGKTYSFVSGLALETPSGTTSATGPMGEEIEKYKKTVLGTAAIVRQSPMNAVWPGGNYYIYSPKFIQKTKAQADGTKYAWERLDLSTDPQDFLAKRGTILIYHDPNFKAY